MLFKQLLKHLQSNKIYKVKAVMWCVMPTPRMDAILQAQAEFIDMFTMDDEKTAKIESGLIWPNVVIVCKGKVKTETLNLKVKIIFSSTLTWRMM